MRRMGRGSAALLWGTLSGAILLGSATDVGAGHVLVDLAEQQVLEAADADAPGDGGRVADLLLIAVLRERIASGALTLDARVPVLAVSGDRGPRLATHDPVEIGELLQLLLLCDSRTAAKTLAWAAGPTIGRTLARMRDTATRLGLRRTTVSDDWPFAAGLTIAEQARHRAGTTARELGRLAMAVASDPDIRHRLELDGVPIANGGTIVRTTAPLIALESSSSSSPERTANEPRLAIAERDGLTLLVAATGPNGGQEAVTALDQGFRRYRRVELVHAGQAVGPSVRVRGGIIPRVNAVAAEAWAVTTRRASPTGLAVHLQLSPTVDAPVEVHQALGELVIEHDGSIVGVVPLVASQAIASSGWLDTARESTSR